MAALAAAAFAWPAQAKVDARPDDGAVAARINGQAVYAFTVDLTLRLAREKQPRLSRTGALEAIIVNRLLAAEARRRFDAADLYPSAQVAFARDVALDDQLVSALRAVYGNDIEAALRALPGASLDSLIGAQSRPQSAELDAVFGQPDRLRLDYALTPQQADAARKLALLRYRLPDGQQGTITLYDVYRRQNVQGRLELHNRNLAFLQQQARLRLAGLFVQYWARQAFGAAAVDDLRRALSDQDDVQGMLQQYGIGADLHGPSKVLDRLAAQVTREEIAAYYQSHRQEFERIERVKARHIRVADETLAHQVAAAANKGEDFAALARRHSQADDRIAGGDLGWIEHRGELDWLAQLAYSQPAGKVSPPVRTPVGPAEAAAWEIVLVEQRVNGYQAPDSEAVRYIAGKAIAQEKAVQQFKSLRDRLLREADIRINSKALDQPLDLLADKS